MKKALLWTIGGIVAAFVAVQVGILVFILLVFGSIGENTVVQTLPSPDGTYEARVIDVDQGALGGNTVVEVERNGFLTWPKQIYIGDWSEWKTMQIQWKDEHTLMINGKVYRVEL